MTGLRRKSIFERNYPTHQVLGLLSLAFSFVALCILLFCPQVCLNKDQTAEEGQKIAENIMNLLQIGQEDLITGAYVDMLKQSA